MQKNTSKGGSGVSSHSSHEHHYIFVWAIFGGHVLVCARTMLSEPLHALASARSERGRWRRRRRCTDAVDAPIEWVDFFCCLRGQISHLLVYRQGRGRVRRESPVVRFGVSSVQLLAGGMCEPILPCGLCVAWKRGWGDSRASCMGVFL